MSSSPKRQKDPGRAGRAAKWSPWCLSGIGVAAWSMAMAQGPGLPPIPVGTTRYNLVVPAGFPPPPVPADNALTVEGVALGKRLFNETRLSGNNRQACASCHRSGFALSDAGHSVSTGIDGQAGTRNAPGLFNLVYQSRYFWDGRAPTLRAQALAPIQNPIEMHSTLTAAVAKLKADASYPGQFSRAFGSDGITSARIGLALEQFMISILSGDSKFDRAQRGQATLTAQEQRGFLLFRTPFDPRRGQFGADCARCHGGPQFSNFEFRNNGLDATFSDPGRGGVTGRADDLGKFKTPSLRNIAATGPYMHDGRFATLDAVVKHYSSGIVASPTLDPGLARQPGGVGLSTADQKALVAFLKTLNDPAMTGGAAAP